MLNLILAIHIMACILLIGLVLVQKSEGGGLGLGGGGGNSIFSARGAAGAIVRTTMIVGGIFLATSLGLTALAQRQAKEKSAVERALEGEKTDSLNPFATGPSTTAPAPAPTTGGLFDPSAAPSTAPVTSPPSDPVAMPPASGSSGSATLTVPAAPTTPTSPPAEAPDPNPPLSEAPDENAPQ